MGFMLKDSTALDLLAQVNKRFEAGEAIDEVAALQAEFKIFSPEHSLRKSYSLLNIKPADPSERRRWYRALDEHLKTYESDLPGVNGHDRLVKAYQDNLEDPKPLPIFTQCHAAKDDPRVLVTRGTPIVFVADEHLIISIPTTAAGQTPAARAGGGYATP